MSPVLGYTSWKYLHHEKVSGDIRHSESRRVSQETRCDDNMLWMSVSMNIMSNIILSSSDIWYEFFLYSIFMKRASVSWSHILTRILCTYHLDVICFIEWKYWTNSDILPSTSKILFCRRVFCSLRLLVGVNINTLIPVARIWAQPLSH